MKLATAFFIALCFSCLAGAKDPCLSLIGVSSDTNTQELAYSANGLVQTFKTAAQTARISLNIVDGDATSAIGLLIDYINEKFPPVRAVTEKFFIPNRALKDFKPGESQTFHSVNTPENIAEFIKVTAKPVNGRDISFSVVRRRFHVSLPQNTWQSVRAFIASVLPAVTAPIVPIRETSLKFDARADFSRVISVELEDNWITGKYLNNFEAGNEQMSKAVVYAMVTEVNPIGD